MVENGWRSAKDSLPRRGIGRVDVSTGTGSLQSGSDEETRAGSRISSGSSVSTRRNTQRARREMSRKAHKLPRSTRKLQYFFLMSTYFPRKYPVFQQPASPDEKTRSGPRVSSGSSVSTSRKIGNRKRKI